MPRVIAFRGVRKLAIAFLLSAIAGSAAADVAADRYLFNDSHFHLTNYVQQGTNIRTYMKIMGDKIGRSTLFGIPLQQMWSYGNSGDFAPAYYLQSDAPLYYYSFTDAFIANAYLSLPPVDRNRLDPMITGFNPADMYAADHIRRVLETYPGVFSGIGEFSIHKEFVSSKVAGEVASLTNPALDRILDFAAADVLYLDNAVFDGLVAGPLAAGAFFVGAAAHDPGDRIIYNQSTGALIFDVNGNHSGGAVQFATVVNHAALTSADFFVI